VSIELACASREALCSLFIHFTVLPVHIKAGATA